MLNVYALPHGLSLPKFSRETDASVLSPRMRATEYSPGWSEAKPRGAERNPGYIDNLFLAREGGRQGVNR